jgi:hypothetical protein
MNELQIATGKRPIMSKSQNGLLKLMFDCVRNNEALTFEQLIYCYAENVNAEIDQYNWYGPSLIKHNVIDSYKNDTLYWNRKIKPLIKSWFVSAIGLLVIKGYLKVLPNINID